MNGNFYEDNLLKSMKINYLKKQNNISNPLQFFSTPNLTELKNQDNFNNNKNDRQNSIINNDQNNGLNNNLLNISENEIFNIELDQSTASIITNQNISPQLPLENPSNKKSNNSNVKDKCNVGAIKGQNLFQLQDNEEEIGNNNKNNEILKYKDIEEKLHNECLINKEQKNYIEILKQTINNCLLKKENINICNLDEATKKLDKNPIDILTEYTSYKIENEKIKKQLILYQILHKDMKNEVTNLVQENNDLKASTEKLAKENKTLQKIREELSRNYDILRKESEGIKNDLLKYEEEFTKCQNNNNDYIRLKNVNNELSTNYEKQKNLLLNLENDFNKINKSYNELIKIKEKLVKENQQLKKELFHKSNELENINNKMSNNMNDMKVNNDLLLKEKKDLIDSMNDIKNKNEELFEIKNNQKIEINSLNKIINDKNNEIVKYLNEIQYLKSNNNATKKLSGNIDLDLIINNVQNELKEKNKLIEDLKSQNAKLIKENDYKENEIKEYITKENNKKKEINNLNNEDKKYGEKINRLNTIIKQKELEIYAFKNNEKSYNKIIDLSFQSILEFINKIKNCKEFKDESYLNIDFNDNNSENNLFITPLKEYINKMKEENKNNNFYNGNNIPLIEKIKKINIFTNIAQLEIDSLYNKIKTMQQENKVLLNLKNKNMNNNDDLDNSSINIIKENDNNISINLNLKKNSNSNSNYNSNNISQNTSKYRFDIFDNYKKINTNNNSTIFVDNTNSEKNNIKNIKSINSTRNDINDITYNQSENININLESIFNDNKSKYRTNSNSLNKIDNNILNINSKNEKDKENPFSDLTSIKSDNSKIDKINLKVKEVNDYLFNNSNVNNEILIFNEEEINYLNNNKKGKINLLDEIANQNKGGKKSRITLFKEEISNRNILNKEDKNKNKNIFLSIQTNEEMKNKDESNNYFYKKNSQNNFSNNLNNINKISLKNNNSFSKNINFLNNNINNIHNINISQPVTNRANDNNNLTINNKNQKKNFLNNRNIKKNVFEELTASGASKNILNSRTIDSSRFNNNIVPSLNDNSFLNKNKIIDDKNKKNELYQKNINGLADEVMKPSFLKSDVTMTMLGGGLNINKNNDSFLFLAKNKIRNKNRQNDNSSFYDIKSNSKRNYSPFNRSNSNSKNRKNQSNLHRNKSFLY